MLGKQCGELGDAPGALGHFTALLDCGHRAAAAQQHYLSQFLEAVTRAGVSGVRAHSCGAGARVPTTSSVPVEFGTRLSLTHSTCCCWQCCAVLRCLLHALQPIPGLPLPAVVTDSVTVHYADQRCYAGGLGAAAAAAAAAGAAAARPGDDGAAAAAAAATWQQLEQLLAGGDAPSTNWLEGAKQVRLSCCAALVAARFHVLPACV